MTAASSPGKIILTGEHAVLWGCPALAMAVTPRVTCTAHPDVKSELVLQVPGRPQVRMSAAECARAEASVRAQHAEGRPPDTPEDLLTVAVNTLTPGWTGRLVFETALPIGSGMGASAAFLLAVARVLCPGLSTRDLYHRCLELEHLQHGVSSGLDLWTSLHGGLWWIQGDTREPLSLPQIPPFRLMHSGTPEVSTGECVRHVEEHHAGREGLADHFRSVALSTRQALESLEGEAWSAAIRDNHRLLCEVGVVPSSVQKVIRTLEEAGGAAKVCGAGAIRGDGAGVVLVRESPPELLPPHWTDIGAVYSPTGTQ